MVPIISPGALAALLLLNLVGIVSLAGSSLRGSRHHAFLAFLLVSHLPIYYSAYLIATRFQSPQLHWVLPLQFSFFFLFGPLIYGWLTEKMSPSTSFLNSLKRFLPHGIIAIAVLLWLFSSNVLNAFENTYFRACASLHFLGYIIAALLYLWRHYAGLSWNYSEAPLIRILIPLSALLLLLMQCLIELSVATLDIVPIENIATHLIVLRGSLNTVLVIFLLLTPALELFHIKHPSVSQKCDSVPLCTEETSTLVPERAETRRMPHDSAKQLICVLEKAMTEHQWYLEPELNLQNLADKMSVNIYDLSEAINKIDGNNFYKFVNRYRIEHAKSMIENSEEKPRMKEICYSSGFNNRTSFNNAFKDAIGETPSAYYKMLNIANTV